MKNSTISLLLIIVAAACSGAAAGDSWFQTTTKGKKTITKLHFYVHDVTGENATIYQVANSSITDTSPTGFGRINVFDDRVTEGPDIESAEVARAQGSTTSADLQDRASAMNLNFYLKAGEFNGSTISVVGRNQFSLPERELPVVGGTGALRYARGYAITSTYASGVLEYTIYVISPATAIEKFL